MNLVIFSNKTLIQSSHLFPCFTFYTGFFTLNSHGQGDFSFDQITSLNGLSHNTVYAITQDDQGFMWFGTREGLNRFDGENIITYYANPADSTSLISNQISSLLAYFDEGLFIGTYSGLSYFDKRRGLFSEVLVGGNSLGGVNKIYQASDSSVFVCSSRGLFVKENGRAEFERVSLSGSARDIIEFKKGIYWVLSPHRIRMINSFGETIKEYKSFRGDSNEQIALFHNTSCLLKSKDGSIWLGTIKNGMFKYNPGKDRFESILSEPVYNKLEVLFVRSMAEDMDGNLWIGTESGLFIYNPKKDSLISYGQSLDNSPGLNDKAIYSLFRSKENIMWVGTYFGGVNMMRTQRKGFYAFEADGGKYSLSGKAVSDIIKDREGKYWIATEDGGISIWDRPSNQISYLKHRPGDDNSLRVNNVHALHEDQDGTMWIGTFLGGLNRYDPKTGIVTTFDNLGENKPLNSNMVYSIQRDHQGTLWVGTQSGLYTFDEVSDQLVEYRPDVFKNKFVYEILQDSRGNLWFCINLQDTLIKFDVASNAIKKYNYRAPYDPNRDSPGVISALEDSEARLWFGTVNDGFLLFDQATETFINYSVEDGLPNNYVYGILEDGEGDLWLSTNKGLSEFDPEKGTFRNYNTSHGIPQNQFNFKSAYKDEAGWMYFGTINGLCYFHPDSIAINSFPPSVYLSGLRLFNKRIEVGQYAPLDESIEFIEELELKASENVITFEFGSVDYFSPERRAYAYYLEGFQEEWNEVGEKKTATYTNLSPGKYTFKVKAANNDGVWSTNERTLSIIVNPPFWRSAWAFVLYVFLLTGIIVLYRIFLKRRQKEKMAVEIERLEKDKIREVNEHKLNFFTYISHEFKTPLTLIIALIDKFLGKDRTNDAVLKSDYQLIKKNAKRLQVLIDQLMEFRKMELDHARIDYKQGDLILFLQDTFNAFSPLFISKDIEHEFTSSHAQYITYLDSDKLEKVITNLISNAVKHTSSEGKIELEVDVLTAEEPKSVRIILSDSGHGIDQKNLDKIFAPFYQTEEGRMDKTGSGIGLALVKSLVDFMRGTISVSSNLSRGTFITIKLPLNDDLSIDGVQTIEGNKNIDIEHEVIADVLPLKPTEEAENEEQFELLIIEDNIEVLNLLIDHFSGSYRVNYARNGVKALARMERVLPDAIISDVMMPEMDGISFCKEIKSNIKTSHIPVILLTANASVDNRLKGLDVGADMFMTKPFNLREIDLRIRNILSAREHLKQHFLKFATVSEVKIPIANKDQDFLKRLTRIVEDNIEDSDFNITTFCQEAGISRSLLHLKLKKLVNLSASEFVKAIRLQKAVHLITDSELAISEVAYKVGYSDPNYFTRTFKEKYGSSPTDYRNAHVNS